MPAPSTCARPPRDWCYRARTLICWPARFSLHHALLDLQGTAHAGEAPRAQAHLTLPDLAPLSGAAGMDIAGRASLDLDVSQQGATIAAAVKGAVAVTGGADPLPGLIGEHGAIDLAIALNGAEVSLRHLSVSGKAMAADAAGALRGGMLSLDWSAALTDLGVLQPQITGRLEAHGHAAGGVPGMVPTGMAQAPPGHASSGQASSGQAPPGLAPPGQAPPGQAPPGLAPHGQAAPGQASPIASAETPPRRVFR